MYIQELVGIAERERERERERGGGGGEIARVDPLNSVQCSYINI